MPNVNPVAQNPGSKPGAGTGATPTPNTYPQWGVKQVSGQSGYGTAKSDYSVEKAANAAAKTKLLANGYDIWFASQTGANNYVKGQVSNANNPAVKGANQLGSALDFLQGLTQASLWYRIAMVAGGGILIIVTVGHMTGANSKIVRAGVKAAPFLA